LKDEALTMNDNDLKGFAFNVDIARTYFIENRDEKIKECRLKLDHQSALYYAKKEKKQKKNATQGDNGSEAMEEDNPPETLSDTPPQPSGDNLNTQPQVQVPPPTAPPKTSRTNNKSPEEILVSKVEAAMKGRLDSIQKQLDQLTKSLQKNRGAPVNKDRPQPVQPNGGQTHSRKQTAPTYAQALKANRFGQPPFYPGMYPMFPNPYYPQMFPVGEIPFDGTRGKPPYRNPPFRSKDISGKTSQTRVNPKGHKDKRVNPNQQTNANAKNKGNAPGSEKNPQR
jgi:hypothetical protein